MQQHQVDPVFVAKNNLDLASPTGSDGTNPDFTFSISSLFPADNSDTETDSTSDMNETSPRFFHYSNSIVSFFPPFRSPIDSPENYEIITPNPNPSTTITLSFLHFFPVPTSLSIPYIFPPTISETETDDSCSESNDKAGAQFSYSIASLFPPARSPTDSSSSENYEIIPTDPSISASPRRTIRKANFKDLIKFVKPKINRNISKSNETPPKFSHYQKKKSILSFFSTAKSLTNSSKRPRDTIQTTSFKDQQQEFLLQSLLKATNNFSEDHKIGPDRFGSIYRATLHDGREVAIKSDNCALPSQSVLEALPPLNHKNVVCFLGFCEHDNKNIWVYEYMENGSLHDHLHKLQSTSVIWPARIKMALDAAKGIEYLHVQAVPPIIHRNIKPSNILLDVMWTAKVSDFSLSVEAPEDDESHHLSDLVGTLGYVDPEFLMHQESTTKIDVYSFGIVLLEIMSGYKAIHTDENGVQQHIVDFVVPYIAQDEIHRVLDPKVVPPTPLEMEMLAYVGSLAVDCASPDRQNRPSMTEVVKRLQRAMAACGS